MGTSPLMCQQMLCGFCNICRHLVCWKQATLTNLKLLTLPNGKPIARLVKPLAANSLLSKMEMMTWSHNQEKWEMNYLKEKNWKVRCNDTFLEAECKPMSNVQVCANDQKHYKYYKYHVFNLLSDACTSSSCLFWLRINTTEMSLRLRKCSSTKKCHSKY